VTCNSTHTEFNVISPLQNINANMLQCDFIRTLPMLDLRASKHFPLNWPRSQTYESLTTHHCL